MARAMLAQSPFVISIINFCCSPWRWQTNIQQTVALFR